MFKLPLFLVIILLNRFEFQCYIQVRLKYYKLYSKCAMPESAKQKACELEVAAEKKAAYEYSWY